MDIQAEKELIKSELDKVDDIHLVEAIKNILAFGMAKRFEQNLKPMSEEAFYKRNEESQKAIKENKLVSQSDAKLFFERKHGK
ncbi:MAG: hypothetical protein RIF46_04865 [Cyclobacteriaceae bacterium]